jgi:hypothetical protein
MALPVALRPRNMKIRSILAGMALFCVGLVAGYLLGETRSREYPTFAHFRSTRSFAHTFRIPTIDFEKVPLADAVDYLRSLTRTPVEVEGGPSYRKLNFVVIDPGKIARPLNLRLRDVPLDRLCDLIAEDSGLEVTFGRDAVVFSARKAQPAPNAEEPSAPRPE